MTPSTTVRRSHLWRWRRSPLRRREDVLEAWILLAVWLVTAVAGPVAGVLSARATVDSLARQRAERRPATAVLVREAPRGFVSGEVAIDHVITTVRWTAADGTSHTGRTRVNAGLKAGERVAVWMDREDRLTTEPQTPGQADIVATFMGAAAFLGVATAAAAGFYGARVVLDRRRSRAWEAEWRKQGSRWGRASN
ncbi:Rv1733c family protein [Streptomyces luteogriseus]|uniref:Rv1733c family protein n=1 Tax=Streptomyces luteogriseus TaxID=68233 RepID=UPI0036CFBBC5